MQIYIAEFRSPMYPEDNQQFGAYTFREAAEARNREEMEFARLDPCYPELYQKRPECYCVTELELEGIEGLA